MRYDLAMNSYLNYGWSFVNGFEPSFLEELPKDAPFVDLPHAAKLEPVHYFDEKSYQGIFTYQKIFDLPDPTKPVQILTFDGAMLQIHVYLNGHDYGNFVSGFFPVSIDISKEVNPKGNRLTVVLNAAEDPSVPPFGKAVDYLTFAGLYRGVHIDSHESAYISNLFVHGGMNGKLHVETTIQGNTNGLTPHFMLYEGEKLVQEFDQSDIAIAHPHLWSTKDPFLYRLVTALGNETREDTFGFRDAKWTPKGFFLNGEYTKLIGLNRHQNYPYVGPAMPKAGQIDDAHILKEQLGCTIVRTSHYADDESFLDECDKIGLLVLDEVPGWQYIGADQAWRANFQDFVKRLILKERNHPSLIAYGLRIDESPDDHALYSQAEKTAHELDPFRQTTGVRNFKTSECLEDIYAYNDFSCNGLTHGLDDPKSCKGAKGKPMIISEFNGHMYPTKPWDPIDRRVKHALRHARVLDDAYSYPELCGAIGWCAFDYNTHQDFGSGDHICYHGVADIFRNRKIAAYLYQSQTQENVFEVAATFAVGDSNECLMRAAYVFTDCDYVELYRNDRFIKKFTPDTKNFPHLPHAPILVDDFIGETFDEPQIKKSDYAGVTKVINEAAQHGSTRLGLPSKLYVATRLAKYHLSFDDLTKIYSKYISNWGEKAAVWTFKGFKNGKQVALKKLGPSTLFHYGSSVSKDHLQNGEVYDVARVSLKKLDQYNTQMAYAFDPIQLEVSGPIALMGPSLISLEGGDISVYLRSLPVTKKTDASLKITGESGTLVIPFTVS
jgi:beta-galactosidase